MVIVFDFLIFCTSLFYAAISMSVHPFSENKHNYYIEIKNKCCNTWITEMKLIVKLGL